MWPKKRCFERSAAFTVGMVLFVLGAGSCAFTSQVVNRTPFDEPEMIFDNLLPDRDLPDKPAAIVSEWGSGAGGGAVGGCWSCG